MRRKGNNVTFICGSDNHGTPVVVSAEKEGVTPRELCERFHTHFYETFRRMNVVFDHFGMTDNPVNHHRTRSLVQTLIDKGYVYPEIVKQCYCTKCQRFLPDRYVEGTCPHCGAIARGDECDQGCGKHLEPGEIKNPTCTVCGTKSEFRDQEHFFFKLSEFKDFLKDYLPKLKGTQNARNYSLGWVNDSLHDWCITRTLDWGVKFPGRSDLVVYVWVDAPIGYIAFTEEWAKENGKDWQDLWCRENGEVIHFIGGDIVYHHCIFWPALLKGAGYNLPDAVVASGMLKVDDHKFSKSRGYVVWTNEDYLDSGLSSDYLRYYLLAYTSHTKELNFSWSAFQERINNELVNILGNFTYRTLSIANSKFGGIPEGEVSEEILAKIRETISIVDSAMNEYDFKFTVDSIMGLAAFGNNYIQTNEPWKLIKKDKNEASLVILNCLQLVKALTILIEPLIPDLAQGLWEQMGCEDTVSDSHIPETGIQLKAGGLKNPTILFHKIDDEMVQKLSDTLSERVKIADKKSLKEELVNIDDFHRLDIKIGKILSAEAVPKSTKLLKLMVDIGEEVRQIVSGISQFYSTDDLVGKHVVVLVNLAPAKIFGIESRGMILAAGDEASLLIPLRDVENGTKIR